MSDITMCRDKTCKIKESCYRYTAKPNEYRQAYFMQSPRTTAGCVYFWENYEAKEKSNEGKRTEAD